MRFVIRLPDWEASHHLTAKGAVFVMLRTCVSSIIAPIQWRLATKLPGGQLYFAARITQRGAQ